MRHARVNLPRSSVQQVAEKETPVALSKEEKAKIMEEYATRPGDTGSPEV